LKAQFNDREYTDKEISLLETSIHKIRFSEDINKIPENILRGSNSFNIEIILRKNSSDYRILIRDEFVFQKRNASKTQEIL